MEEDEVVGEIETDKVRAVDINATDKTSGVTPSACNHSRCWLDAYETSNMYSAMDRNKQNE